MSSQIKPPQKPRMPCIHLRECGRCVARCDRYEIADEDQEAQRRIDEALRQQINDALHGGCCGGQNGRVTAMPIDNQPM